MSAQEAQKLLLTIIELGGYPNFTPLYESLGFEVAIATRMHQPRRLSRVDVFDRCSTLGL